MPELCVDGIRLDCDAELMRGRPQDGAGRHLVLDEPLKPG